MWSVWSKVAKSDDGPGVSQLLQYRWRFAQALFDGLAARQAGSGGQIRNSSRLEVSQAFVVCCLKGGGGN
jgi:hypothetical protein